MKKQIVKPEEKKVSLESLMIETSRLFSLLAEMGGELSEEQEKQLNEITGKMIRKVDATIFVLEKVEGDIEFAAMQKLKWAQREKSAKANLERIEERIKYHMLTKELTELNGKHEAFKLVPTQGAVVITDHKKAEELFGEKVVTETIKVPLSKIKAAIESGQEVLCAKIQQNWSLRRGRAK
jgi:hypothetical protein